ncbi:kinase-like domain-containing protein [Ephemerocybe angulata]|uniref:Kinase-like domain-containing protein n=1 Tax=Ephemerocybe angulata TaxID=980116 RepID=A0A8H6IAC0_9AGAR|nr:kinase-like domain-containing protein [Tulosesus angulatus]
MWPSDILDDPHRRSAEPVREKGVTREVVNSHTATLSHEEYKEKCPDISIKATGPSFQKSKAADEFAPGIGYSTVAAVIDVSLEQTSKEIDEVSQLAIYCRHIFLEQPNRNFVRSLIVTHNSVRLVHYDRSGVYVTPYINIHQYPRTFIRLVLGITSPDERDLGLDTSIQWSIDKATGRRAAGTIDTIDDHNQPICYNLDAGQPPFVRSGIRGRSTTCWHAYHPVTGKRVIIKDAWRISGTRSEREYLEAARDIPGVVQMLSYQDDIAETKDFRPVNPRNPHFESRVKSRLVLEHYGSSVIHFRTRAQAIGAIRDAIIGHYNLLSKSVLHRDVSLQNILLGVPDSPVGLRGILIDLDLAIWTHSPRAEIQVDVLKGTYRFLSIAVLRSAGAKCTPPHDFLDDLEAFFYVLSHILLLFKEPGVRDEDMVEIFKRWNNANPEHASDSKTAFLMRSWTPSQWWGSAAQDLFTGFKILIFSIQNEKDALRNRIIYEPESMRKQLDDFGKVVGDQYEKVLKLFDDALLVIEREDRKAVESDALSTAPNQPACLQPSPLKNSRPQASLKRGTEEEAHPEQPLAKRRRVSAEPPPRSQEMNS